MSIYFQVDDYKDLKCDFCGKKVGLEHDFYALERIIACLDRDGCADIEGSADIEILCFTCDDRLQSMGRADKNRRTKEPTSEPNPSKRSGRKLTIPEKGKQ